jgi:hypothetical protein
VETIRTIWNDLKLVLKQLNDDLEIPDLQGQYWTLVAADRLRMLHIVKRRSGAFLSTFVLPLETDASNGRRCITLPRSIYDLDKDGGIETLSYWIPSQSGPQLEFKQVTSHRVDPSIIRSITMGGYAAATPEHPYHWREGERIYLDGPGDSLQNIEAKLYCNLPDITSINDYLDEPFDFPKELLHVLTMEVMNRGRMALTYPGQYLTNDGTNRPAGQVLGTPEKTTSVNSAVNNPSNEE